MVNCDDVDVIYLSCVHAAFTLAVQKVYSFAHANSFPALFCFGLLRRGGMIALEGARTKWCGDGIHSATMPRTASVFRASAAEDSGRRRLERWRPLWCDSLVTEIDR